MIRTLRMRLLLIGIGVALFAVVVSAFAVQRLTKNEIQGSLDNQVQRVRDIQDELTIVSSLEGGWADIEDDVERLSVKYDERIAIVDADGELIADSELARFDREAPLPRQAFVLDPSSALLAPDPSTDVIDQFEQVTDELGVCLDDLDVPFDVSPGQFGLDLFDVPGGIDPTQVASIEGCLDELKVDFGDLDLPEGWMTDSRPVPSEIPAVQLFVGYGDRPANSLFPSPWSWRFWLAVGLPLLAAMIAMALTARRMLGPIGSLTVAAEQMHRGDLTVRAEVRGRDELAQLGTAFNDMAGALQASDQARRVLTSDVAHELRSPLANLRGWIEGIQDGVVQPTPAVMESLHEEALNLQALVEDLQDLSLAEAGQLPLHRESTSLVEIATRVAELHQPTAAAAGVTVEVDASEQIVASVDRRRFHQVVVNLVSNAVRHAPAGSAVYIGVRRDAGQAIVSVADQGPGIAPEHLPMVFDRFWRGDQSRTRSTGGSGLGLAIVRQLVNAHHGTVEVRSTLGAGTVFEVRIPCEVPLATTTVPLAPPISNR